MQRVHIPPGNGYICNSLAVSGSASFCQLTLALLPPCTTLPIGGCSLAHPATWRVSINCKSDLSTLASQPTGSGQTKKVEDELTA